MTNQRMYGAFYNTDSFSHSINNKIQLVLSRKAKKSYDNLPVFGEVVTEKELEMFCREINDEINQRCAIRNTYKKSIDVSALKDLGLVYEVRNEIVPTIGLCLLIGKPVEGVNSKIRCKISKNGIVEEKVFDGKIHKQIEDVCNFIIGTFDLRNTVDITGKFILIPEIVIRELICNVVCHRDYLSDKDVEIFLDEEKLMIANPCINLDEKFLASIKQGYSKIYNRKIISVLAYKNMVHDFGSGIPTTLNTCEIFGMPEPKFSMVEDLFKVEVFRNKKSNLN